MNPQSAQYHCSIEQRKIASPEYRTWCIFGGRCLVPHVMLLFMYTSGIFRILSALPSLWSSRATYKYISYISAYTCKFLLTLVTGFRLIVTQTYQRSWSSDYFACIVWTSLLEPMLVAISSDAPRGPCQTTNMRIPRSVIPGWYSRKSFGPLRKVCLWELYESYIFLMSSQVPPSSWARSALTRAWFLS